MSESLRNVDELGYDETRIKRRCILVGHGHSRIEVAVDDGHIVIGEQRAPLTEIELELNAGEESDLCYTQPNSESEILTD